MPVPSSSRRPFARALPSPICSVASLPDRRLAVLTKQGIFVLDEALRTVAESPGADLRETWVSALADGRMLVSDRQFGSLYLATGGKPLEKIDLGEGGYATHTAVTRHGFFAEVTSHRLLVDRDGTRRLLAVEGSYHHGLAPVEDGALGAGYDGFVIYDAAGEVRARHGVPLDAVPVPVGGGFVVSGRGSLGWMDGTGRRSTLPVAETTETLSPFGKGVLRSDGKEVVYYEVRDGRLEAMWRFAKDNLMRPAALPNGLVVISSWSEPLAIVRDAEGKSHEVPLPAPLGFAGAFGDGVAMSLQRHPAVVWWRPGAEMQLLTHDVGPYWLWETPIGLACFEEEVLYLWREEEDGPDVPELSPGDMPLGTMIVLQGRMLELQPGGRFALRAVTRDGYPMRVRPGTPFRHVVSKDEALARIQALIAERPRRDLTSPDPAHPELPDMDELGLAVGMSGRRVLSAVRAGRFPLEPPRAVPGHEYIGAFVTSDKLSVSDPCYLEKKQHAGGLSLCLRLSALAGRWHAFIRPGTNEDQSRTAELVVIHERGFFTVADERLGTIGIDSGRAGVFDRAIAKWDSEAPLEERTFLGQCAVASTGYGDGAYDVFGGRLNGDLVKIRIHFLGPTPPELDAAAITASPAAARPYSPSEAFTVGESVSHKKFGTGIVTRIDAGKMVVVFGQEARTLVCAK